MFIRRLHYAWIVFAVGFVRVLGSRVIESRVIPDDQMAQLRSTDLNAGGTVDPPGAVKPGSPDEERRQRRRFDNH